MKPPTYEVSCPLGSPPLRYFTHFVLFFVEANEKTPEEKAAQKEKHAERERARLNR
ncbi:unnamed protein product [marine sediment metagenome]|uniref:Uncharacterized protein n=1 Tax=marine sediment metagenome TaxID=412755 RepID=X0TN62_9ZZZZ